MPSPLPVAVSAATESYHMTPDEFRRHGHALVDWIAEYYAARRVVACTQPSCTRRHPHFAPGRAPDPRGSV